MSFVKYTCGVKFSDTLYYMCKLQLTWSLPGHSWERKIWGQTPVPSQNVIENCSRSILFMLPTAEYKAAVGQT